MTAVLLYFSKTYLVVVIISRLWLLMSPARKLILYSIKIVMIMLLVINSTLLACVCVCVRACVVGIYTQRATVAGWVR